MSAAGPAVGQGLASDGAGAGAGADVGADTDVDAAAGIRHWAGRARSGGLVESCRSQGYALLKLDAASASTVHAAMGTCGAYFEGCDADTKLATKVSSKLGYKRLGQKERYQLRATAPGDARLERATPPSPPRFMGNLTATWDLFQCIAHGCLEALLDSAGISYSGLVLQHCDPHLTPERGLSTSVFNCYYYFNEDSGGTGEHDSSSNCVEHTDPGLITVLGRGTAPGLEVEPREAGAAVPCCTGARPFDALEVGAGAGADTGAGAAKLGAERPWVLLEPLMAADDVVVLVGESLGRATGGRFPPCLHRVVGNGTQQPRLNITYELRPAKAIFAAMGPSAEATTPT